ncbi:MAG: sulfatase [Planctomycetes bacterium]|nr:sulfatase [Planctomycetota bacterium]MBL7008579.1 sulfatase [Planctomycetota bacterium]
MSRLGRLLAAGLCLPALSSCGRDPGADAVAGNGRPVILISIDSLRADHCTPYGHQPQFAKDEATTPFLARLAAEGVLWENASAPTAWTLPSHISIVTGMAPQQHGVNVQGLRVPVGTQHLAGKFQEAGYLTAGFYSAPYLHPMWGFSEGFDTYLGAASYLNSVQTAEAITDPDTSMDGVHTNADSDAETAVQVVDQAIAWLEKGDRHQQPFFLFLHLWDPHYDYQPPADYAQRFHPGWQGMDGVDFYKNWKAGREYSPDEVDHAKALYDAEIRYTDDHIARLYAQLEAWGIADQVILAIVSDHGDEFYEHQLIGHHKTLYQEIVHVPMVLRAPGLAPAGRRLKGTAAIYDLAPTLLDLAGLEPWPDRTGKSLRPMWTGDDADRTVVFQLEHPGRKVFLKGWRQGKDKVLFQWQPRKESYRWVFDLAADPGEFKPTVLQRLAETAVGQRAFEALRAADESGLEAIKMGALPEEMVKALAGVGYVDGDEPEDD